MDTESLSNDDWHSTQAQEIQATIPPTDDLESAIVATLAPGAYTATVQDATHSTGTGLFEVYNLEPVRLAASQGLEP